MNYKVAIINKYTLKEEAHQFFEKYPSAQNFGAGADFALKISEKHLSYDVKLTENKPKQDGCSCPVKKNDGSPFDGVSYYCPLHGR